MPYEGGSCDVTHECTVPIVSDVHPSVLKKVLRASHRES